MSCKTALYAAFTIAAFAGPVVAQTEAEITDFMRLRGNQVMSAQSFPLFPDRAVWSRSVGVSSEVEEAETSAAIGAVGAQTSFGDTATVGVMLQFDQVESDMDIEGTGFFAGPYVVARLPDRPLFVEGRLLAGVTRNEADMDDAPAQEFDTTRALASAKISGQFDYGMTRLSPSLSVKHLSETREAFFDSTDTEIADQSLRMTDLVFGLDASRDVALERGMLTLTGGLGAVWSATEGSGIDAIFEGERGRAHVGVSYARDNGMVLSAGTRVDGLGRDDLESTSFDLGLRMQF